MALQLAIAESNIGPGFPEAYVRISSGRSFKSEVSITVDYYANEAARLAEKATVQQVFYSADVSVLDVQAGDHPHAPYYRYLKALPEFAGAIDV